MSRWDTEDYTKEVYMKKGNKKREKKNIKRSTKKDIKYITYKYNI